jgi:biopolymer transport protein TolR
MSDINVTPLVDVMLVLLVVFMITAPLLTVGVPIELPKTQANQMSGDNEPLIISITEKNEIFIQKTEISIEDLIEKLQAIAGIGYIKGDRNINYEIVMKVMGRISSAGYSSIGLITDLEE